MTPSRAPRPLYRVDKLLFVTSVTVENLFVVSSSLSTFGQVSSPFDLTDTDNGPSSVGLNTWILSKIVKVQITKEVHTNDTVRVEVREFTVLKLQGKRGLIFYRARPDHLTVTGSSHVRTHDKNE